MNHSILEKTKDVHSFKDAIMIQFQENIAVIQILIPHVLYGMIQFLFAVQIHILKMKIVNSDTLIPIKIAD